MFCSKCGKQIEDDAKFCEHCGAAMNERAVSSEKVEQSVVNNNASVKRKINKPLMIAIIVIVAIGILGVVGAVAFEKYFYKKGDEAIKAVQDSYFEFLPEMTVGELITEYYDINENSWLYDSSEEQVEFWGTNKKDNSGMSVTFRQIDDNTISTYSRMFHLEGEASHNITMEEFEEYILSLYAQLDDSYQKNTQTVTEQITTTKVTTTTAATTTVTKKQEKTEESEIYLIYLAMLNEMDSQFKREYGDMSIPYYQYYLYDINHDGIYELLVHVGESEAEAVISICSVDENGELIDLGEIGGGHTILVEKDGNICTDLCHMGYQIVEKL